MNEIEEFKGLFEDGIEELCIEVISREGLKLITKVGKYHIGTITFNSCINLETGKILRKNYSKHDLRYRCQKEFGKSCMNLGTLVIMFKKSLFTRNIIEFKTRHLYRISARRLIPKDNKYNFGRCCYLLENILEVNNIDLESNKNLKSQYKDKKNKEYQNRMSRITIEHPYFGTCVFEEDHKYETLKLVNGMDTLFGNSVIFENRFIIYKNRLNSVFDSLEKIYRNANSILEKCYAKIQKLVIEYCRAKKIDIEYVKKNYNIDTMYVDEDVVIFFGNVEDEKGDGTFYDGWGEYICINFATGEIECDIVSKNIN